LIRSEVVGRILVNDFTNRYARPKRVALLHNNLQRALSQRESTEGDSFCSRSIRRAFTCMNAIKGYVRRFCVRRVRRSVSVITYQINYSYYFIPLRRFRTLALLRWASSLLSQFCGPNEKSCAVKEKYTHKKQIVQEKLWTFYFGQCQDANRSDYYIYRNCLGWHKIFRIKCTVCGVCVLYILFQFFLESLNLLNIY